MGKDEEEEMSEKQKKSKWEKIKMKNEKIGKSDTLELIEIIEWFHAR